MMDFTNKTALVTGASRGIERAIAQQFDSALLPLSEWSVEAWLGQGINNKPYTAVDSDGRLYVTDPEGYRVLIFSGDGGYLGRFGAFSDTTDGFGLPNGSAINAQDNIYIADAGNNRILKFAPPFTIPNTTTDQINESSGQAEEPNAIQPSPTPGE